MTAHCILTEPSVSPQVRKGREGKGTGKGREVKHPCSSLTVGIDAPPLEAWMLQEQDDLDTLGHHIFCSVCQPVTPLVVKVSLCGVRAMSGGRPIAVPRTEACADCQRLFYAPCDRCGA